MGNDSTVRVKSLKKAIDVLNCFLDKQPLGATEISELLGIYKSNAFDILSTLTALNYLYKDENSGKYYLGIGALKLGRAAAKHLSYKDVARPHMTELADLAEETVYLSIPMSNQVYYVEKVLPSSKNTASYSLGATTDDMHCTSCGKAMLAFMPPKFIEQYLMQPLSSSTDKSITDPVQLRTELDLIRTRGFATDFMEHEIGINCVAVPILGSDNNVVCAMSISGPAQRLTKAKIYELAKEMKKRRVEIEKAIL